MSIKISSPVVYGKKFSRPSTPVRRRFTTKTELNNISSNFLNQLVENLIERLENSTDSSTQILIRLYRHKTQRLQSEPEKLIHFQEDLYRSLRRLHPSLIEEIQSNVENSLSFQPKATIVCRSAQATIRKLN